MGQKTKIDWCDSSWSPVTGCLHGCEYCYARRIAERFKPTQAHSLAVYKGSCIEVGKLHDLKTSVWAYKTSNGEKDNVESVKAPYPFGFEPTFHRYRLDEPQHWKKPRNIFVCSMADLFGEWVPDEWIDEVIKSTQKALQHRYLFLTKNPERYDDWLDRFENGKIDGLDNEVANCWFGASASNNAELERANGTRAMWVSIEPIREHILTDEDQFMQFRYAFGTEIEERRWEWVVIGAETGNQKSKVVPEKEWVKEIAYVCKLYGTPIFMKESLRELMGDDFRQEYPWEVK